jgi:phage gp29-like protein
MPQDGDKARETEYRTAAENVAKGGSGALPFGSQVNYATEARGADPFNAFLARQEKLIVLMATGGTLGSLASPTGIGGGASDVQDKAFADIIMRDCSIIASSMNRICTDQLLNAAFPGRPHLAYFDFADRRPTASQVFDDASKAKSAGYTVAQADLEERTGYTLERDTTVTPPVLNKTEPILNKEETPAPATLLQNDGSALQNASKGVEATKTVSKTPPSPEAILEGITEVTQKSMYEALLDAAIEGATKGKE